MPDQNNYKKVSCIQKIIKLLHLKFKDCLYVYVREKKQYNKSGIKLNGIPYIIHSGADHVGLFSYFLMILGGIAFADRNNLIPVVDMKNYKNNYLYDSEVGQINAWEYYFEQPYNVSLDDALSCKKYILGQDTAKHERPQIDAKSLYNYDGELDYWRGICKKYIRFKPAVIAGLERLQQRTSGKKILGVLVRGTDYTALKPYGHQIPPTPEQAIAKTQEVMQEKNFDAIYLATEDKNILAKFQAAFGDKLIIPEANYLDYDYNNPKLLCNYLADRPNDKYLRGLEYLVSMLFLSKCAGFITSLTSGSTGVMCLSEGFEYLYVFDLGRYS